MSWSIAPILCVAGSSSYFVVTTELGISVRNDVNEALGTSYPKLFGTNRRVIWTHHARLFPASRKRIGVAISMSAHSHWGWRRYIAEY